MIRIPHSEESAFTFEDYDVLLTVYGNRKKLKKGKKAKYTIKSLKSMFFTPDCSCGRGTFRGAAKGKGSLWKLLNAMLRIAGMNNL